MLGFFIPEKKTGSKPRYCCYVCTWFTWNIPQKAVHELNLIKTMVYVLYVRSN